MTSPTSATPEDGDFASWLENRGNPSSSPVPPADSTPPAPTDPTPRKQTIEDVLVHGETPTQEFLEEWRAAEDVPLPSDEEMERQALEAGGEDGNPETPE